jgi:hypothetical protein
VCEVLTEIYIFEARLFGDWYSDKAGGTDGIKWTYFTIGLSGFADGSTEF